MLAPFTATVSTVTVGSYSTSFKSVTEALDRIPDAFSFGSLSGVAPGALVESADLVLSGYNASITLVAGQGLQYSLDSGATYTAAPGRLAVGQKVRVRQTSNASHLGYTKGALKAGGVTGYFTTRTK